MVSQSSSRIRERLPIENAAIDEGMRAITQQAPGVRVFIDPNAGSPAYRFVNLYGSPRLDVVLDETRIAEFAVRQSLEGRAGVVRTTARRVMGSSPVTQAVAMTPAWDEDLESTWFLE